MDKNLRIRTLELLISSMKEKLSPGVEYSQWLLDGVKEWEEELRVLKGR